MISQVDIRLTPKGASVDEIIKTEAANKGRVPISEVHDFKVVRRSIDARQRQVMVNLRVMLAYGEDKEVKIDREVVTLKKVDSTSPQAIIVGAGPAGLFAALKALQSGIKPVILERGDDVDTRRLKLAAMSRSGIVDPNTNYSFGEGGAGAYSDGKLFTRSKKRGNVDEVLKILCHYGAKEDILIEAHPHIGSDRLPGIIRNIREDIIAHGGEVKFNACVSSLLIKDGKAEGVRTSDGMEYHGPVILATGHSARDIYRMLHEKGVALEAKGLAIGTRLEHPQKIIDIVRYHNPNGRGDYLPPAEYSLVTQADGRGVYSFCMCPGGIIVPAATGPCQSVVNGMSPSNRGSRWANSGMVVEVHPGDIEGYAKHGPLEMMVLQEDMEKAFYDEAAAHCENPLNAPAQRMTDFISGKESKDLPRTSLATGIHSARVDRLLPPFISERMKKGLRDFGKKHRGFLTQDGIIIGLESRTSSPVRIPRDEKYVHTGIDMLYPAGEGAGYAGGIVSAAIDGMLCMEALGKRILQ